MKEWNEMVITGQQASAVSDDTDIDQLLYSEMTLSNRHFQ